MALNPTTTRVLLDQLGHQPKRYLGQNFLVDGNIVRKSIELAGVKTGDAIVEIGPGLGTLTSALLEAGAEVWAIEKDPALHAHLARTLAPGQPRLHLREGDAMDEPLAGLPPDRTGEFKIVANLPYAISTPWMDAVLSGPLPELMVLMLQHEAAQRYVTPPGSKLFGAISIFLQSAFEPKSGHRVAPGCFLPKPEVDSVLLNLARRPEPFVFTAVTKAVIRGCFQQRRKQIGSLLRHRLPAADAARWIEELSAAGLGPQARPEQIPGALWQRLVVRDGAA
ncbi:MAG TPA: 16S rRNA (adenine(1518)-N(6)/adenine(1519)-N(6))-dimethyltransferase RsmA [Lacunisphaera sp.]|nr:16S rRNA (adenine(1518)-N(6)/adenine(1519)-N(6))-dimethyltransferase RsmA [Lacunisphaera sp.]